MLPLEVIVVDDSSTDDTRAVANRARADGLVDVVICHGTRCGRSAAINAAARFARGDLLLTVDADTVFEPTAVARLAAAFDDPRVAGASSNIGVSNERASRWTSLQHVEYLMSISAGRAVLDIFGVLACLSGACSMFRRDVFLRHGGLDVGPGEDLEITLRLRRLGYAVRFVADATAETLGVVGGISLLRQRARWDRDSLRVRFMMYGEFRLFHPREHLQDTLQRLDFIIFDLVPTISFSVLSGVSVCMVRQRGSAVDGGRVCRAALDRLVQHGAFFRHVRSHAEPFQPHGGADLSILSGHLPEACVLLLVFVGDFVRDVLP